jgi:lipopolysaccharide transport system permease protein
MTTESLTTPPTLVPAPALYVRIAPSRGWALGKLKELWQYRELLYFLVWRDIKVRYKQTILGLFWAILQPVMTMIVFSIFFGRLAGVPSDGIPYPIFSYAALVPWTFFTYGLNQGANSLVSSAQMLKKIYFPRLAMPLAAVLSGLVDFGLAFVVLFLLMIGYGVTLTASALWLPAFLLLAMITTVGVCLWLSAMNVQFRDVRYVIPFLTQLWFFITPITYPSSLLDEPWRTLYSLNPMVGVVDGFRWALLGTTTLSATALLASWSAALLLLVSGIYYFNRMEKSFADVV